MQTEEFRNELDSLIEAAAGETTAILCAEALPWRCHRLLVSDGLLALKIEVRHILGPGNVRPHRLTRFGRIAGGCVIYDVEIPAEAGPQQGSLFPAKDGENAAS